MSDPFYRTMLAEVCAEADAAGRDFAQWEAQRAARQVKRKSFDDDLLVYKTHMNEPPAQQSTTMSPEVERQWNDWFDRRMATALQQNNDALVDATVEYFAEHMKALSTKVDALEAEIKTLRGKAFNKRHSNAA